MMDKPVTQGQALGCIVAIIVVVVILYLLVNFADNFRFI